MRIGINLSFATKKWQNPETLASFIRQELNINYVQFSWDIIDPWWPASKRKKIAYKFAKVFRDQGLNLLSSFGGLASYTYPQLLSKEKEQRNISKIYFKRAIDLASEMGIDIIGTPLGGIAIEDYDNKNKKYELYNELIENIAELSVYAKMKGLKKILVEPTPLSNEIPNSPDDSLQLMKDFEKIASIPIMLLIDLGHALYKPLLKENADIVKWINICRDYIDSLHIQQTDGVLDRHWGFSQNGIVDQNVFKNINNLLGEKIIGYLELIFPFEMNREEVMKEVKYSIEYISQYSSNH